MKLYIFILFTASLYSQQISYSFSSLSGVEDKLGNTNLLYGLYYADYQYNNHWGNQIHAYNVKSKSDSILFGTGGKLSGNTNQGSFISYSLWDQNPNKYIICRTIIDGLILPPSIYIERFDRLKYFVGNGDGGNIVISNQNDSLLYANLPYLSQSLDGGINWETLDSTVYLVSMSPFNDKILFCKDIYGELLKSLDGANSFYKVHVQNNISRFYYDKDSIHIYAIGGSEDSSFIFISNNAGESYSWFKKYSTDKTNLLLSVNSAQSGNIYITDKNKILVSNNYGENFSLFKKLERKIVGIYKKPNSNKLYAATKYNLYEITSDSIKTIKHLQIDPEIFSWFPLHVGDKWIYKNTFYGDYDQQTEYKSVWELVRYVSNSDKHYAEIKKNVIDINEPFIPESDRIYFRTDSLYGRIYIAYLEDDTLKEKLYLDLTLELGDTIYNYNNKVPYAHDDKLTCFSQGDFQIFDLDTERKEYATNFLTLKLVKGLGLFYYYGGALVWSDRTLKGAVINGIVYGDTTLTDIEESENIPVSFSLSQNYPNPFNPSTTISYQIPRAGFVSLKIYNVLGEEIKTLVSDFKAKGKYNVKFNANDLASGIYIYQLKSGNYLNTKKLMLLK